jgi:predicted ATPase
MKISSIEIHNFKTFQDAKTTNIPDLAVFIGKNGSGKSSFFDIFHFLHD